MTIQTTRFGQVEIKSEDLIEFKEGVLGFGQLRKFVILDDPTDEVFAWLQSCERPEVAFPVLEPEFFAANYKFTLTKSDMEALGIKGLDRVKVFCIVTIPEDPAMMTANLKAPILINIPDRLARQCVLQDNNLAIREPIFVQLQARVVQGPLRPQAPIENSANEIPRIPVRRPELEG
jgi:flagellar assembly factor FliW